MARQDSYANDTTITGTDRVLGQDAPTGQVRNFLFSDIADFIGAEFSISGNTITLPDNRTFNTGITSLLGVSLTNLPTTEPATVGLPWRQGQIIKISGQSTDLFELVSAGAGDGIGPLVDLYRNSSSPATNDVIGGTRYSGNNSTGVKTNYGEIRGEISIATGNGSVVIAPSIAGAPTATLTATGSNTTINNDLVVIGGTTTNGTITLANLPTTDPGITNRLWNDGGTPILSGSTAAPVVSTTAAGITIDGVTTPYPAGSGGTSVQGNWNETDATAGSFINNKPRIELSGTTNVVAGGITVNGLPTTDPGVTNAIWNDGGIPRISGTTTIPTTVLDLASTQTVTGFKTMEAGMVIGGGSSLVPLTFSNTNGNVGAFLTTRTTTGGLNIQAFDVAGTAGVFGLTTFTTEGITMSGNLSLTDTGGVTFGTQATTASPAAASTSKTLDDYEEGTWTPRALSLTATDGSTSLTDITARYTKIGRIVHLESRFRLPANNDISSFRISGLPFNSLSGGALGSFRAGLTLGTAQVLTTTISLYQMDGRTISYLEIPQPTVGTQIIELSVTYKTDL